MQCAPISRLSTIDRRFAANHWSAGHNKPAVPPVKLGWEGSGARTRTAKSYSPFRLKVIHFFSSFVFGLKGGLKYDYQTQARTGRAHLLRARGGQGTLGPIFVFAVSVFFFFLFLLILLKIVGIWTSLVADMGLQRIATIVV